MNLYTGDSSYIGTAKARFVQSVQLGICLRNRFVLAVICCLIYHGSVA